MLCLTVDIDWAHDLVIHDTLSLIEQFGEKATWFVTHETPLLIEILSSTGHELGIHPNFNPLLEGMPGNSLQILETLMELVPEARALRSHSLTRSSKLSNFFRKVGITHESNIFLPPHINSQIEAWRDYSGLIQVPIRWEDDVRLIDDSIGEPVEHLNRTNLFVVDVHPIHIYLNTLTIDDYENSRAHMQDPGWLLANRRPKNCGGTRDRLIALLEIVKSKKIENCRLSSIQVVNGKN